jgi:hypothetical protein
VGRGSYFNAHNIQTIGFQPTSYPKETCASQFPQAPPCPSSLTTASHTLAKTVGILNNFNPENWTLLTAQSQEWYITKMQPVIKELRHTRRTTEWDTITTCPSPPNTLLIKSSNLATSNVEIALKVLAQTGLHPVQKDNCRFEHTQHPNKSVTLAATLQLDIPVTDLLRNLFVGNIAIKGSMGPIRLEIVPEQDSHQMCLTPKSHKDRKAMSHLVPIYSTLGATVEEILLLFQLQAEQALSDPSKIFKQSWWFVQQGIIQGDFDEYCQELKKTTTPAGEVELIALSLILERCIVVHRWQGSCYRPIESFGSQYKGHQSPILVTYTATGEGHYDGLVPMDPIPGASRPQRSHRKVQRVGQVDEERMMLVNILQTLPEGEQTKESLPADLMGTIRNRVAELRRVMESNSSAHLNTVKLLEERMRCIRESMPLSDIRDELVRALQTRTECGQLATLRPRTFCADDCDGHPPLPCCNQRHPVLRRMGRTKCGPTEGGITLEDSSQHCDGGPWIVGGDEEVGKHLVTTRSIQSGEIITGFVSVTIVSTKSVEGCELEALQKHAWQSDSGRHFQYTYRAKYTENEGVWC